MKPYIRPELEEITDEGLLDLLDEAFRGDDDRRARAPRTYGAKLISMEQMARRAGVTLRRLDLWVTKGYLQPAIAPGGTGRPRRWYEWQIGEVIEVREQHDQARVRRS